MRVFLQTSVSEVHQALPPQGTINDFPHTLTHIIPTQQFITTTLPRALFTFFLSHTHTLAHINLVLCQRVNMPISTLFKYCYQYHGNFLSTVHSNVINNTPILFFCYTFWPHYPGTVGKGHHRNINLIELILPISQGFLTTTFSTLPFGFFSPHPCPHYPGTVAKGQQHNINLIKVMLGMRRRFSSTPFPTQHFCIFFTTPFPTIFFRKYS